MPTTVESRRTILFVDDDLRFLEMVQRVLGALSEERWEILIADSTSRALAVLQDQEVHLVVIDLQMPVVDGFQFLTLLNRRHPNLQKVVLTGYATDAQRAACLGSGAELFLEKPKTFAEQQSLFAALNEILKWQPADGFSGVLRRVGLEEVIQMECLARHSAVLMVKGRNDQGRIVIKEGAIIHAEAGHRRGAEAFHHLLAIPGGEFWLKPFAEPPEPTLEAPWEFLLLEASRRRDELAATPAPPAPDPETTAAAPGLAPAPPPVRTAAEAEQVCPANQGSADPAAPGSGPAELPALPVALASEPAPVSLEEVLVCSGEGEVLYDWRCRTPDLGIRLLEFVSQKSRQLAQGLMLGSFDRLILEDHGARVLVLTSAQRGVLVRCGVEPAVAAS